MLRFNYDIVSNLHLPSDVETDCESKFDGDDGESKVDYDDCSIQYSINSRDRLPGLNENHLVAMLLSPKDNSVVGEEQLDHTSLYSAKGEPESDDDDDDDYGFTNLKQKLGANDTELTANSTTQSLHILKRKIAEKRGTIAGEAKLPISGVSQQEVWSPKQVDIFLNEFKGLHRRKLEEVAALESRLQTQKEIEVDLKEENEQLKCTYAEHKNQNSRLLASIKEIEKRLQHQNISVQNCSTENEKLTQTNKDLLFKLEKLEQYATIQEGDMKAKHEASKDEHNKMVDAMEERLSRSESLVQGLQTHSRSVEEERDEAVQVMQDGLDRQESVAKKAAKKYKKKYLNLKEECDSLGQTIKSQQEKIALLEEVESDKIAQLEEAEKDRIALLEEVESDTIALLEEVKNDKIALLEEVENDKIALLEEVENDKIALLKEVENDKIARLEEVVNDKIALLEEVENDKIALLKRVENDKIALLKRVENDKIARLEEVENDKIARLEEVENDKIALQEEVENDKIAWLEEVEKDTISRKDETKEPIHKSSSLLGKLRKLVEKTRNRTSKRKTRKL